LTVYIEISAAAKLLVEEPESAALGAYLDDLADNDVALVSSMLLETELRRLAVRHDLSQAAVSTYSTGSICSSRIARSTLRLASSPEPTCEACTPCTSQWPCALLRSQWSPTTSDSPKRLARLDCGSKHRRSALR
jgi:hypothetical protein